MKKIFLINILLNLIISNIFSAEYTLYGNVFNYDNTSGTAQTPNSFAFLNAYRKGIAGQIGHQHNGESLTYPEKIYSAYGENPAYFFSDVGSSDWALTQPQEGQVIISVVEVFEPENGWIGESYIGITATVITANDIVNSQTTMPPIVLHLIPSPQILYEGNNQIKIGWMGIDNDFIVGYTIYRSDDNGINYNPIGITGQARCEQIIYFDNSGLVPGNTYYYKIAVNVLWNGGGNAPLYYETQAKSKPSLGAKLNTETFTPTLTYSFTVTPTFTYTFTETFTYTATDTITNTETLTNTYTETATFTYSATYTLTTTNTFTETATFTYTQTNTLTPSFTETFTFTLTPILFITPTETPILLANNLILNLKNKKVVILENPIKKNKIKIGIYAEEQEVAEVFIYNIFSELILKFKIEVNPGINIFEEDLNKKLSSGLYIIRIKLKEKNYIRKIGIIN